MHFTLFVNIFLSVSFVLADVLAESLSHVNQVPLLYDSPDAPLVIQMVNNFPGVGKVNAYITGLDYNITPERPDGSLFFVQEDGQLYYPENPVPGRGNVPVTAPVAIPLESQGSTRSIKLNSYINSGRIWLAVGELKFFVNYGVNGTNLVQPSVTSRDDYNSFVNWGFAELAWATISSTVTKVTADISYVDFVGLAIAMKLTSSKFPDQSVEGLPGDGVDLVCNGLKKQTVIDGMPWNRLCIADEAGDGNLRVLSPINHPDGVNEAFSGYWDKNVTDTYTHYETNDITINTQNADWGDVTGRVDPSSEAFVFKDDPTAGTFEEPNAMDIFGCNTGPFANAGTALHINIGARLCAAFNRGTLMSDKGDIQPNGPAPSSYYTNSPTNHYSRIVHENEIDGKGYAFSYDDVTPSGSPDLSGTLAVLFPEVLTLYVGGSDSSPFRDEL